MKCGCSILIYKMEVSNKTRVLEVFCQVPVFRIFQAAKYKIEYNFSVIESLDRYLYPITINGLKSLKLIGNPCKK